MLCLSAILAEGPKLFEIPGDMVADLNQIDIPLSFDEYCQPFPALIVKCGNEYQYVVHDTTDKLLVLSTFLDAKNDPNADIYCDHLGWAAMSGRTLDLKQAYAVAFCGGFARLAVRAA